MREILFFGGALGLGLTCLGLGPALSFAQYAKNINGYIRYLCRYNYGQEVVSAMKKSKEKTIKNIMVFCLKYLKNTCSSGAKKLKSYFSSTKTQKNPCSSGAKPIFF